MKMPNEKEQIATIINNIGKEAFFRITAIVLQEKFLELAEELHSLADDCKEGKCEKVGKPKK